MSIGSFVDYQIQLSNTLGKTDDTMLVVYTVSDRLPEEHLKNIGEGIKMDVLSRSGPIYQPATFIRLLHSYRAVLRDINKFQPDIVHFQIGSPILAFFYPFLRRYRRVTTFHDVIAHPGEGKRWESLLMKYMRRSSDRILVHGEKLKQMMIEMDSSFQGRVHSIPIGPHNIEPFMIHARDDLEEETGRVLFFGRIHEYKGLEYLIKAEPLITKEIPEARIVIAGTGEDFRKYEDMMVNKDHFIVYNHHIPYKEGAEIFQKCSLVALPYSDASQSGVISTAYGFKKPVVVTDVGALAESVDDGVTGLIVPPRDPQALADAIIRLLKDDVLRKRMGENAYRKLNTDMSWDRIVGMTGEVYRQSLNSRN
ncbi:MAG: glycosyltransferase family 4 protein [Methanocella sp.]